MPQPIDYERKQLRPKARKWPVVRVIALVVYWLIALAIFAALAYLIREDLT